MARPTVPREVKQARGTYRRPVNEECVHAYRRKSKARAVYAAGLISEEILAAYEEAVDYAEQRTPHIGDSHGIPDEESLTEIEVVEGVINSHLPAEAVDLTLKSSRLHRMIREWSPR